MVHAWNHDGLTGLKGKIDTLDPQMKRLTQPMRDRCGQQDTTVERRHASGSRTRRLTWELTGAVQPVKRASAMTGAAGVAVAGTVGSLAVIVNAAATPRARSSCGDRDVAVAARRAPALGQEPVPLGVMNPEPPPPPELTGAPRPGRGARCRHRHHRSSHRHRHRRWFWDWCPQRRYRRHPRPRPRPCRRRWFRRRRLRDHLRGTATARGSETCCPFAPPPVPPRASTVVPVPPPPPPPPARRPDPRGCFRLGARQTRHLHHRRGTRHPDRWWRRCQHTTTVDPAGTPKTRAAHSRGDEVAALAADEHLQCLTGRYRNRGVGRAAVPSVARISVAASASGTVGDNADLAHTGEHDELVRGGLVQIRIVEHLGAGHSTEREREHSCHHQHPGQEPSRAAPHAHLTPYLSRGSSALYRSRCHTPRCSTSCAGCAHE